MAVAYFGAGCFWGVEEAFRTLPGVTRTQVGFMGGHTTNPTYEEVCTDRTGHAEAVRVEYDPARISYADLLKVFWEIHDPTTPDRQGPDVGKQYRSAVFYVSEEDRRQATSYKTDLERAGTFTRPIVTEILPAAEFWPAEEYHQHYYQKKGLKGCHL